MKLTDEELTDISAEATIAEAAQRDCESPGMSIGTDWVRLMADELRSLRASNLAMRAVVDAAKDWRLDEESQRAQRGGYRPRAAFDLLVKLDEYIAATKDVPT